MQHNDAYITKKKTLILFLALLISIPNLLTLNSFAEKNILLNNINWNASLFISSETGIHDTIFFGESPDANDGNPPDSYDIPKPPLYLPPCIRARFSDNLTIPYNALSHDYRHYPDTEKIWNITIQWIPADYISSTMIIISWNKTRLNQSPYAHIMLCLSNHTPLLDMLTCTSYSYNSPAMTPTEFHIHATTTTYELNTTILGNGDLIIMPQQSSYYPGTSVHLTAIPQSNWVFSHWTGGITGKNSTQIIHMNENKVIRAHFIINDTSPPKLYLEQPIHGLYLNGRLLHRYRIKRKPIIIGSLQITIKAEDSQTSINRLELYIDNKLIESVNSSHLNFNWKQERIHFFKNRHLLTVKAYDDNENVAEQQMKVIKLR